MMVHIWRKNIGYIEVNLRCNNSHGCLHNRYDVDVMMEEYSSSFVEVLDFQVANSKGVVWRYGK
jgi:hypothetical protein